MYIVAHSFLHEKFPFTATSVSESYGDMFPEEVFQRYGREHAKDLQVGTVIVAYRKRDQKLFTATVAELPTSVTFR